MRKSNVYSSKLPLLFAPKGVKRFAITLFGTAYYSVPKAEVQDSWRRHEDCHKMQQSKDGLIFYVKYLWYMVKYGYRDNPYEVEARRCE